MVDRPIAKTTLQNMFECSKAHAERYDVAITTFFVSTMLFEEIINDTKVQRDATRLIEGKRVITNVKLSPTNGLLVTIIEDNDRVPTEVTLEQQWKNS
ncbi:hypothetical protein KKE14_02305 [Patescibacteria group bacterium]|nr:hypothetical protein [Patescibacteria group bacterium]